MGGLGNLLLGSERLSWICRLFLDGAGGLFNLGWNFSKTRGCKREVEVQVVCCMWYVTFAVASKYWSPAGLRVLGEECGEL